jgi:hypothetical protein
MQYNAFMIKSHLRDLPQAFCWTRFGTEAGEPIEQILRRKEVERCANNGVFFWGVGNSVAPGMAKLIKRTDRPEVLFSPIRGRPRRVDTNPACIVEWTEGETLFGSRFELPKTVAIKSRGDALALKVPHYALVCSREDPLEMSDLGRLSIYALRNLLSGNALGASQVTAIVIRTNEQITDGATYPITLRAALVAPYFIRLRNPVLLEDGEEALVA